MIRRQESHDEKTGNERWLVSYADFITLLFGFFLVMYSVSQVNEAKYQTLSETLSTTFLSSSESTRPKDGTELNSGSTEEQVDANEILTSETLAHQLNSQLHGILDGEAVAIDYSEQWVEITLDATLLFASGDAKMSAGAQSILTEVAEPLLNVESQIEVGGHTDNIPISNEHFSSNWSLSSARAVAVVDALTQQGIKPMRLSAVGYGEFRPVADNTSREGRAQNRRVVLRISEVKAAEKNAFQELEVSPQEQNAEFVPLAESDFIQGLSDEQQSDVSQPAKPQTVAPVELKNGGLLFSRDPDMPRKSYR